MNEMKNSIEHGKFLSYVKIHFEEMNTTHAEYGLLFSKHPVLILKYSKSRGKMLEYESLYRKANADGLIRNRTLCPVLTIHHRISNLPVLHILLLSCLYFHFKIQCEPLQVITCIWLFY